MEFCVNLSHHPWIRGGQEAVDRTLETIRVSDQAGIDSVWLSEDPDGWDAFTVLGAAARTTERVRLGTGVTNPYLRHPNLLAMSVATLDRLSGGRAFLGLGRGQPEWYQRRLGLQVGNPLQALEDTAGLVRQWWRPPFRASVDREFAVDDWAHAFGPTEFPPIYLAAVGPQALRLAARTFDGLMMTEFASADFLGRLVDDLRRWLAAGGRDLTSFPIFARTAIEVTDDPEPALERRKNLIALINALPGMSRPMETPGIDVEAIMERVRRVMKTDEMLAAGNAFIDMRQTADLTAARRLIPTELVDELSFVGPAAKIRAKLRVLRSIGVSHVYVTPPASLDAAEFRQMLDAIRP